MPKPQPVPDTKPKRRTPTDVQRERLTERIERIKADARSAEERQIAEIRDNAKDELEKKITNARRRVANRFGVRLAPLLTMLAALNVDAQADEKPGAE